MTKGFFCVLLATALWGFAFLSPKLLPTCNTLEIITGRYLVFGSLSLLIFLKKKMWKSFTSIDFKKSFIFAITSNILFYSFLVLSLRFAGGTLGSLIVGLLPLTLSLYGNSITREFSFKLLILPLIVIFIGLTALNIDELILDIQSNDPSLVWKKVWGICCGLLAVACWTWYGVANAQYLKHNSHIKSADWAILLGLGTLFGTSVLFLTTYITTPSLYHILKLPVLSNEMVWYLSISLLLGSVFTWLPTVMWNKASQYLPVSLLGQLIVFEPTFALLYNYGYEKLFPNSLEWTGIILILGGVSWSLFRINKAKKLIKQTNS